jgi:ubiquinone/menaquinone biosynthesis C-methylase UbiE
MEWRIRDQVGRQRHRRDNVLAPIADALLEAASIVSGEVVIDLGCGCGATTIAAANAAPSGIRAVGVDLSQPMLAEARRRVAGMDPSAIAFIQADVQTAALPGPFDVAISRFGTMFFDDPIAAFANIGRHMQRDGRLAIVTWQPLDANEWLLVPGAALVEYGQLPDDASSSGPGMFAQSDPDEIASVLTDAGWRDVQVVPRTAPMTVGADIDEALTYLAESGPGRAVINTIAAADMDAAMDAVRARLAPYRTRSGVVLEAGVYVTTARRAIRASD